MKQYQGSDPLHGHGKAIPKPKQPTRFTSNKLRGKLIEYRGGLLYRKANRNRRGNIRPPATIRVDCCRNGHLSLGESLALAS